MPTWRLTISRYARRLLQLPSPLRRLTRKSWLRRRARSRSRDEERKSPAEEQTSESGPNQVVQWGAPETGMDAHIENREYHETFMRAAIKMVSQFLGPDKLLTFLLCYCKEQRRPYWRHRCLEVVEESVQSHLGNRLTRSPGRGCPPRR